MNTPELNFAVAGAACMAVLEAMVEFGYVPTAHLDHAKKVITEHKEAHKAWVDSMERANAAN